MITSDFRKKMADSWFSYLQTQICKSFEFERIKNEGIKRREEAFFLQVLQSNSNPYSRLGVIATKKLGNAVERNRAKRQIREVFRKNSSAILPSLDMIVLPRKKMKQLKFAELEKRFLEAIKKLSF